ncbi:MAG: sulfotransferase [Phycisphaerales bacterium]
MPPDASQQKQLHALLRKLSNAIDSGYAAQALAKLNQLHAKSPRDVNILTLLARANAKMGRHPETIEAYAKASGLMPRDADLHFKLATALQRGGRYEDALLEYERALYNDPKHFFAQRHKTSVLTDLNRLDDADRTLKALEEQVVHEDLSHDLRLGLAISAARLAPGVRDASECIDGIREHIGHAGEKSMLTAGYYQMGRLHHLLKQHDEAFACFKACKEVEKDQWDPEAHSARVDRLIGCWCGDEAIPFSEIDGSRLVFIVGMMRSGTSLTEQMLAQIPSVTPGGELNAISRQISEIETTKMRHGRPMPVTRGLYTQPRLRTMAAAAMAWYDRVAATGTVTDKQPYNHAYVPLIAHMSPGCRFIHCVRDPLDCCLSNFTQSFSRPHMQTHDLYWLGRYYADYERMMAAWHTLDEVEMIDLHYERLVSDPEGQARRVVEFLGLPWSDDILRFHESDRTVSTASRDQVRKPLYTTAVAKHKPFEPHLDELKRGLQDGRARGGGAA